MGVQAEPSKTVTNNGWNDVLWRDNTVVKVWLDCDLDQKKYFVHVWMR